MKAVVLGAHGMVGHLVAVYLKECGHDIIGVGRKPMEYLQRYECGDLRDENFIAAVLMRTLPDMIVNCAGVLYNLESNVENAIYINSYLPHRIADIADRIGARFIQISTDCVFSGKRGNYRETDVPDEVNLYGRTKALGEVVRPPHLTFRNSIIGPDINPGGRGLFHWFMEQEKGIEGYSNVIWSGVTSLVLAEAIDKVWEFKLSGLYHLSNNATITKCDLCMLFNTYFRNREINILPVLKPQSNKSVVCTRTDFPFIVPTYEKMIEAMKELILDHKKLYTYEL